MAFVGVDPQGLERLAAKLRALSDCLAKDAPLVVASIDGWGSALDYSPFRQAPGSSLDDATKMSRRADLAMELANAPRTPLTDGTTLCMPRDWNAALPERTANPRWATTRDDTAKTLTDVNYTGSPDLVMISWDAGDSDYAAQAAADEYQLKLALANPGKPWSTDTVSRIGQTLTDHQGDTAYLKAFYEAGGSTDIFKVGHILNPSEIPDSANNWGSLQPTEAAVAAQYGTALAAAMKAGLVPNTVPDSVFSATGDPGDSWSLALLLKYGPPGDQWDPQFLSNIGTKALVWNLNTEGTAFSMQVPNPATITVLERLGENADASRDFLTGPQQKNNIQNMLFMQQALFQSNNGAAAVIAQATTDRTPAHADQSVQAALNLITGLNGWDPTKAPPFLSSAVATAAIPYINDLAFSSGGGDKIDTIGQEPDNKDQLMLTMPTLRNLLEFIAQDKTSAGQFNAYIAGLATDQITAAGANPSPAVVKELKNAVYRAGTLQGLFAIAQQHGDLNAAQHQDAVHADAIAWTTAVLGGFGNAALPDKAILNDGQVSAGIGGVFPSALWPTNNASNDIAQAQEKLYVSRSALDVPIAQGLINTGQVPWPTADDKWFHDGVVSPANDQEAVEFNNWFQKQPQDLGIVAMQAFADASPLYNIQ